MSGPVITFEMLDEKGNVLELWEGPTREEIQREHDNGVCNFLCPICYHLACEFLKLTEEQKAASISE